MCLITQQLELCGHQECLSFYAYFAIILYYYYKSTEEETIISTIQNQDHVLRMIIDKNYNNDHMLHKLHDDAQKLSVFLHNKKHNDMIIEPSYDENEVFNLLKSSQSFKYKISLESQIQNPVYKERGFSILVSLRNSHDQIVVLRQNTRFRVLVFTQEEQPKKLISSISGKRIIRGTIESEMHGSGILNFENIVINEVSSHYPNEVFCLVVISISSIEIKPLVINDLIVKARTIKR